MTATDGKVTRVALTAMVVGSMVGAGIFSLPRTFAGATGPLGAIIAWIIVGIIAGWIAEKIMGRNDGLLMNLVIGVVGTSVSGARPAGK